MGMRIDIPLQVDALEHNDLITHILNSLENDPSRYPRPLPSDGSLLDTLFFLVNAEAFRIL